MVPEAPVPVAPEVIESHAALEDALQEQLAPLVEIVTDPLPPAAVTEAEVGERPDTTHAAAAWVKVKVCPPAVIVAEREVVAELAAAE